MPSDRLAHVLARIDALNSQDPNREAVGGIERPHELVDAERITQWVLRLNPQASEALRIAARGQHLCRWMIPRDRYERDRQGYLRWRETLKAFHAKRVGELMREAGYPDHEIARVQAIMSKRFLPDDADTQTLEDALCLVFLETELGAMRHKTPQEKLRDIIRKTWAKISPAAKTIAGQLPLSAEDRAVIARALEGS